MALQPVSRSHDRSELCLTVQQLLLTPCDQDPLRHLSREGVPVGPLYFVNVMDDMKVASLLIIIVDNNIQEYLVGLNLFMLLHNNWGRRFYLYTH